MDAAEDAIAAARIAAAKDEDDLDSEDESYLDNEEIAHRNLPTLSSVITCTKLWLLGSRPELLQPRAQLAS